MKETVVQAQWKNWISVAVFRAGVIGTTWGTDGCLLRYKYQVRPKQLKKTPDQQKNQLKHLIQCCFTNASNPTRKAERTSKDIHMTDRTTENFHTWTWRICLLLNIRVFNKPTKSKVVVNRSVQGRKNIEIYFLLERKGQN